VNGLRRRKLGEAIACAPIGEWQSTARLSSASWSRWQTHKIHTVRFATLAFYHGNFTALGAGYSVGAGCAWFAEECAPCASRARTVPSGRSSVTTSVSGGYIDVDTRELIAVAIGEHVSILARGVAEWNAWRADNPRMVPDLRRAPLQGVDLRLAKLSDCDLKYADLSEANLEGARIGDSYLRRAILRGTYLSGAKASGANFRHADLTGAKLMRATLRRADLSKANLHRADLTGANLNYARLVETDLRGAWLPGCTVYGVAAWNLRLDSAVQSNLIVTSGPEPTVTVDGLEVAQFVYLALHTPKLRDVIDAVTAKAVLIVGRFTEERKAVLEALRDALRVRDRLPIIFDFDPPKHRDLMETVRTLAHLSRFIVADLTDPRSVPRELATIVPALPSVPVQAVVQEGQEPWAAFVTLRRFPWVLEPYRYATARVLMAELDERVLAPAEAAVERQRGKR
jgi:uncharacterized protein YjbI with pentapeptide repeats